MDDYPDHLAPEFDVGGGVSTPFSEWWPRVKSDFPNVPEEVAREWLHRHWQHSPFSFLKSRDHEFQLVQWPISELPKIRTNVDLFREHQTELLDWGRYLVEEHHPTWSYWLTGFMLDHGDFPSPPVLLDNRDQHICDRLEPDFYPTAFMLVEGHRRLAIATYLAATGRMKPQLSFWLMTHLKT